VVETGKHRVAPVTGGGRALALALAAEGAAVAVVSRTRSELDETARAIRDRGGAAVPIVADVTRPTEVARVVEEARTLGPIELLINNAGVGRGGRAVRPLHHGE